MKSGNTIVIGACLTVGALAAGGLGLFVLSRSAYRRARLEAIVEEPARLFDSSWLLQGAAFGVLIVGLVGLVMVALGIRDSRSRDRAVR